MVPGKTEEHSEAENPGGQVPQPVIGNNRINFPKRSANMPAIFLYQ